MQNPPDQKEDSKRNRDGKNVKVRRRKPKRTALSDILFAISLHFAGNCGGSPTNFDNLWGCQRLGNDIVEFLGLIVNSQYVNTHRRDADSDIIGRIFMARKKRKPEARPVFDSIRKPTAPPSRKMGDEKPEEKARPSLRKTKHKRKIEQNGDI